MQIAGFVALLLVGSIPQQELHTASEPPPIQDCSVLPPDQQEFTASVNVIVDIHGDGGELIECPTVGFGMNFSKIDLDKAYPDLRRQISISVVVTYQPIDMKVRGYFAFDRETHRRILFVTKIYSWRTHGPPIPRPARN
jgi:hypothetical protein